MRISFQTGYRNTLADIERTNADLAKYQQQISSGKRLEVPSDDPTAAVGAVKEHTEIGTLDQFTQSADSANSRLTVIDTVLSDVINKLTQAQATTASAMGNTATAQQRISAADDLAGIRDSLYASFNTMFRGTYLFGGTDTTHAPYVQNPDGSIGAYLGTRRRSRSMSTVRRRCRSPTTPMRITRGADATDVFGVLQNLIADVQSGNQANMQTGMDALKRAFDRAISTQSKVGTDENAVADEQSRLDAMRRAAAARLSSEEDTEHGGGHHRPVRRRHRAQSGAWRRRDDQQALRCWTTCDASVCSRDQRRAAPPHRNQRRHVRRGGRRYHPLSRRPAWIRALPPVRRDFVGRHCAAELPARRRGTVRVISRGGSPGRHARVSLHAGRLGST